MAVKIDGKILAATLREQLRANIQSLVTMNVHPKLALLLVGSDPASLAYIKQKREFGESVGASSPMVHLEESALENDVAAAILQANADQSIHGIVVQLPLPLHIDSQKMIRTVQPEKDVDGFLTNSSFTAPVSEAASLILQHIYTIQQKDDADGNYQSWLHGKNICVLGRGLTGGKPVADAFTKDGYQVTVIHSETKDVSTLTSAADIIISCVGKKRVVTRDMIKEGAILVSVGMHKENGLWKGDYDEEEVKNKASFYTPTPGGVGPVNVACLWKNVVKAAENSI